MMCEALGASVVSADGGMLSICSKFLAHFCAYSFPEEQMRQI